MKSLLITMMLLTGCIEYTVNIPEEKVWGPGKSEPLAQEYIIDTFRRPSLEGVDILFAIDKSCSMMDDFLNLSQNIDTFVDLLSDSNLDYRIAIISTEGVVEGYTGVLGAYNNKRYLSLEDQDPYSTLLGLYNSVNGVGEAGFNAVFTAMWDRHQENTDFFRLGVPLHIITITDEEEQSLDVTVGDMRWLIREAKKLRGADVDYSVIINPYNSECISQENELGLKYELLARLEQDLVINICNTDWSAALTQLGAHNSDHSWEYHLSRWPETKTLEVYIESEGITLEFTNANSLLGGYTYHPISNSISFDQHTPSNKDIVIVKYYGK